MINFVYIVWIKYAQNVYKDFIMILNTKYAGKILQ